MRDGFISICFFIVLFLPNGAFQIDSANFGTTDLTATVEIKFEDRRYIVDLERNTGLFHPEFQTVVDGEHVTSMNSEFIGSVRGPEEGKAILSRFDKDRYIGAIYFANFTFYIEPASYRNKTADPRSLIGRSSSSSSLPDEVKFRHIYQFPPYKSKRDELKNSSIPNEVKNRCSVVVVIDHVFYETVANGNVLIAVNFAINQMARDNFLFERTNFDEGREENINGRGKFQNMGISIKEVIVHTKPDKENNHFNGMIDKKWESLDLLEAFSKFGSSKNACVVHLMTARNLYGSCGISYVAKKDQKLYGICSTSNITGASKRRSLNTLVTTTACQSRYQLLTEKMDLITEHEYGHAFGAAHDPESLENPCSGDETNGRYLMNPYLQDGNKRNNMHFSTCSKQIIREIMETRWSCFEEKATSVCGNKIVEADEECDSGNHTIGDACCHFNCTLRNNARCSFVNHICCNESCQFRDSSHACLEENYQYCHGAAYCNGTWGGCPAPPPRRNGLKCSNGGECFDGSCLYVCSEVSGKKCLCEDGESRSPRCCLTPRGACIPEPNNVRESGSSEQLDTLYDEKTMLLFMIVVICTTFLFLMWEKFGFGEKFKRILQAMRNKTAHED